MSDERNDSLGWEEPLDRRTLLGKAAVAGGALAAGGLLTAGRASAGAEAAAGNVTAFFGQFGAIAEQEGIRRFVLRGFNGDVDAVFAPISAPTQFIDRVRAEAKAGKGSIDVLVGLHGDFVTFQNEGLIRPVGDVARQIRNLPPALVKHGKLGTKTQYFVPHSQATYVMVANKDVIRYLPRGADINAPHVRPALPVGQDDPPADGAEQVRAARERHRPHAPVPPGLPRTVVHRRLRHEVPLEGGRGGVGVPEAALAIHAPTVALVRVHAGSAAQPGGPARLGSRRAVEDGARSAPRRPRRVPRPARPEGPVVHAGPRGDGDPQERAESRRRQGVDQAPDDARSTGGAPLVDGILPGCGRAAVEAALPGLLAEAAAVARQQKAKDAVQALLPVGIGAEGGNFSKYYRDTFTRIVRNGENIQTVLREQGELLDQIFAKTNAPCWAPDPSSGKARCRVA